FLWSYRPTTTSKRCQRMRTSQSPVQGKARGTVRTKISDCRADLYVDFVKVVFRRTTRGRSYLRVVGGELSPRAALLAKWFGLY
ncbi:hypothetical protein J6590_104444, partial [Homalodisca vitripennis]